jgi:5'-3' exonuclease
MGDTSDGFPGLPGWGAKSASTVLGRYLHIENIPAILDKLTGLCGPFKSLSI